MSMGMMMLPPVLVSLPFKILLFVLVDGWALIVTSLADQLSLTRRPRMTDTDSHRDRLQAMTVAAKLARADPASPAWSSASPSRCSSPSPRSRRSTLTFVPKLAGVALVI